MNIIDPTAMVLATATRTGKPSSRVVLLKKVDVEGFCFFTNYDSRKGIQLRQNPFVALTFYWAQAERQVRIEGRVSKTDRAVSDQYFGERSIESQISAIISPQSQPIPDRQYLQDSFDQILLVNKRKPLKRPANWGGYVVKPVLIEFWQGRTNRLHDRTFYRLKGKDWILEQLAP